MPVSWLAQRYGKRVAVGAVVGLVVFLLVFLLVIQLTKPDPVKQMTQTTASAAAIASAASTAVDTVSSRMTAEQEIDAATALAMKELEDAKNSDAVRAAVVSAVCVRDSHRDDPACRVRPADPR